MQDPLPLSVRKSTCKALLLFSYSLFVWCFKATKFCMTKLFRQVFIKNFISIGNIIAQCASTNQVTARFQMVTLLFLFRFPYLSPVLYFTLYRKETDKDAPACLFSSLSKLTFHNAITQFILCLDIPA